MSNKRIYLNATQTHLMLGGASMLFVPWKEQPCETFKSKEYGQIICFPVLVDEDGGSVLVQSDVPLSDLKPPCQVGDKLALCEPWAVCKLNGESIPSMCRRADSTAYPIIDHLYDKYLRGDGLLKWHSPVTMPSAASRFPRICTSIEAVMVAGVWNWRISFDAITRRMTKKEQEQAKITSAMMRDNT